MITLAKNPIAQAAIAAAVWVMASSLAQSGETVSAKSQARHPEMAVAQAFAVLDGKPAAEIHQVSAGKKGNLQVRTDPCAGQSWPYIAPECLTGPTPARQVARTITIERRTADGSALVRVAANQQMALR